MPTRPLRPSLIAWAGALAVIACTVPLACGSGGSGSADAMDAGSSADGADSDAADDATCAREPATAPTWRPPKPLGQNACTSAQLGEYLSSCVNGSPARCDAFRQGNAGCFACVDSDAADPTRGPIVWYANRKIYRVNLAGCLAFAFGDQSAAGCGAADELYADCATLACAGCALGDTPNTGAAADCETSIFGDPAGPCGKYDQPYSQCLSLADASTDAVRRCYGAAGSSDDDFFLQYMTDWCTPPTDGGTAVDGDAGAGDADAD